LPNSLSAVRFMKQQFLGIGADAAEDAEDRLHEERRLDQPAVDEMRQVVEVADVVAFELEARAVALAQVAQDVLDVLEGVAEDEVVGGEVGTASPSRASSLVLRRPSDRCRNSSSPC
jgi:hypothetical protein